MFFNPLFIDTNSTGAVQGQKNAKLGKSQYLFSDIIKISLSQSESSESDTTPSYNLSLVKDGSSVSSLLNSLGSTAVKAKTESDTSVQNPEATLIEFLQYAFLNQDKQGASAVNLKDLMKDKELLLSKDSITNALSQLLQIYQPSVNQTGTADAVTVAGVNTTAVSEALSPEKLASQILSSLDDKGKVALNFKSSGSQIKIELTKLSSQEKELFISTKIIPLSAADAVNKTENSKTQPVSQQAATEQPGNTKATDASASQPQQDTKVVDQSTTQVTDSTVQQAAQTTTELKNTSTKKTAKINISDGSQKKINNLVADEPASTEKSILTKQSQTVNEPENQIIPNVSETVQKSDKVGTTADSTKNNSDLPNTVSDFKAEVNSAKAITVDQKNSSQTVSPDKVIGNQTDKVDQKSVEQTNVTVQKSTVQPESIADNKNNEYKLRVVGITTDKTEQVQDAKIFPMTQFEKNILNKSNITYTSSAAAGKKQTDESAASQALNPSENADENISTVSQADEKILKTNNMLFDGNGDAKQTEKTIKTDTPVIANTKAETDKKESVPETVKPAVDLKSAKTDTRKNIPDEVKQTKAATDAKDISTAKNIKNDNNDQMQIKQAADKTVKQTVLTDDSKTKNTDTRSDASVSTDDSGKKTAAETEKTSFKQSADSGQKDANNSSNQNNSEKKGTDVKQVTIQNVVDKEKTVVLKDDIIKETAKQADVTKTVKTYELIKEIKSFIEQGNKSSMTLNIEPENLGSVRISLDIQKNIVQARINVDSENVKQFVQTNLDSLKQSLNQSGVNVGMLQVNVSSSDQKQQKLVSPYKRRMGNTAGDPSSYEEVDAAVNKKILGYNSYDYLA